MGRRLYVGNLPYTTGEAELQELFSRAGTVESVRVMRDAATGRARGFAFVEMATDEEAQKAAIGIQPVSDGRPRPDRQRGTSQAGRRIRRRRRWLWRQPRRRRWRRRREPRWRDQGRQSLGWRPFRQLHSGMST